MMYIDVRLDMVKDAYGNIRCVQPIVNMGIDLEDNFDLEKLKDFKRSLEKCLEELNYCLTDGNREDADGLIH